MATKYGGYMGKVMLLDLTTQTAKEYPWTDELREKYIGGKIMASKILCDEFRPEGEKIISLFEKELSGHKGWNPCSDNNEGIRISTDAENGNGWFLLRLSVHDPIIVLNTESDEKGGTLRMCRDVLDVISKAENIDIIDISALKDFVK